MVTSPLFANVGFWFTHKPGLALGVTAAGGAMGQAVVPYLCALCLDLYGWQNAYVIIAVGYLALAVPVGLLIRESPTREQSRQQNVSETRFFRSRNEKSLAGSAARLFFVVCVWRFP